MEIKEEYSYNLEQAERFLIEQILIHDLTHDLIHDNLGVPADIQAVPRPVNTIVDNSGRNGPKRYVVRVRASTKYVAGDNPQPKNGKVVGHIIDYKFVPVETADSVMLSILDMLSYDSSAIVELIMRDRFDDLLAVYGPSDVFTFLATLKATKPSVPTCRMSAHYHRCFFCKDYLGAASRNSIRAWNEWNSTRAVLSAPHGRRPSIAVDGRLCRYQHNF